VAVIIEHKVREEKRVFVFPWQSGLYHPTATLLLPPKKVGEERVLRTKGH
jgi:hypothetical protein